MKNYIMYILTPIDKLIDLNKLGLSTAAKDHFKLLNLGDLILMSDDFKYHSKLNDVGEIRLASVEKAIKKTNEYKNIAKHL